MVAYTAWKVTAPWCLLSAAASSDPLALQQALRSSPLYHRLHSTFTITAQLLVMLSEADLAAGMERNSELHDQVRTGTVR